MIIFNMINWKNDQAGQSRRWSIATWSIATLSIGTVVNINVTKRDAPIAPSPLMHRSGGIASCAHARCDTDICQNSRDQLWSLGT